ncbi:imidazole glycerol phosphate synthase subunit HisH [Candidatus Pelagibacter sp.]|jgi:imidazole glycerol-phosphate synthase subunit HisH|nr:imidazole glycerol phosphate synthase subunit HisH [Candidatus Pelagibacter sp.]
MLKKNTKRVGIINLGLSNLGSIINLIVFLKKKVKLIDNFSEMNNFDHIILPGIGSFKEGAKIIKKKKLKVHLNKFINKGGRFFGICLGMQLMFKESNEHGKAKGLGLFEGTCTQFKPKLIKVPHVGFNLINHDNHNIWKGIPKQTSFYFVHSYKVNKRLKKKDTSILYCKYKNPFIAFIRKKNLFGSQFHPEKSGKQGIQLMKNFLEI